MFGLLRRNDWLAPPDGLLSKSLVVARICTGIFFVLFGEYKVSGRTFAHSGFAHYLEGYIQETAVSFYRPFLSHIVLPHAVFFGYLVGAVELLHRAQSDLRGLSPPRICSRNPAHD